MSLINIDNLIGLAKSQSANLSKMAERVLGIKIQPNELRGIFNKAEDLVVNNKDKLRSKDGLKNFLKNDIGASNEDIKRVSKLASGYTNKIPYGREALNILDDMVDTDNHSLRGDYIRSSDTNAVKSNQYNRSSNTQQIISGQRERETYFNADRYRIKK